MSDSIGNHLPDTLNPDVQIMAIEFSEDYEYLEITYVERRFVTESAHKIERVVMNTSTILNKDEYTDVIDSLLGFLDEGLRHIAGNG